MADKATAAVPAAAMPVAEKPHKKKKGKSAEDMTSAQKAAAVIIALGAEKASKI